MTQRAVPELLAPAGSLDAVRAALANGADAVYLGAERFNARDEGAQLTLDELEQACLLAHERGTRVYLTLNVLVKPAELVEALDHLGEAVDRGIDAVIVQDLGLVRLIRELYPALEIHGSTQMTVHDASGARMIQQLGVDRVVLARENTLEDIAAIRHAVPSLGLESFVHGALCIAYSGQCYMSGMISERSANRGSCAQSCRKDYRLHDAESDETLDAGFLISARDLAAYEHLPAIASAGVSCLKVEGRKKKPEYVATVTRGYRQFLDRLRAGQWVPPGATEATPLVQIYSRGFTAGMYGGRVGREYVTRSHPDNRGEELGRVIGSERGEIIVEVRSPLQPGDGVGFEPPTGTAQESLGFAVSSVRTLDIQAGVHRQALRSPIRVAAGWTVVRSSAAALLQQARASFEMVGAGRKTRRIPVHVRVFGSAGGVLKLVCLAGDEEVAVRSDIQLARARQRGLDARQLRDHLSRLGETPFVLGSVDTAGLEPGLFLPISEVNHLRQRLVEELMLRKDWEEQARRSERRMRIEHAVGRVPVLAAPSGAENATLTAEVWRLEDARVAARAGASEISLDLFLRHPMPPVSRVRALVEELANDGVAMRLRTPTIVRPAERRLLDKWLALDLPLQTGHPGLLAEQAREGRVVVGDYALNCFNAHSAALFFELGARRLTLSVELTAQEMAQLVHPWRGRGFEVVVYGRPEGMTIEHCVLSAAFDRTPTTCRDLCVQKHRNVEITDPAGYTFPVATDYACRNRLLHSRPIDGSEYLATLWAAGLRSFRLLFNGFGDDVGAITTAYRRLLEAIAAGELPPATAVRSLLNGRFTRGHFARAV